MKKLQKSELENEVFIFNDKLLGKLPTPERVDEVVSQITGMPLKRRVKLVTSLNSTLIKDLKKLAIDKDLSLSDLIEKIIFENYENY